MSVRCLLRPRLIAGSALVVAIEVHTLVAIERGALVV